MYVPKNPIDKTKQKIVAIENRNYFHNSNGSCYILGVMEVLCRIPEFREKHSVLKHAYDRIIYSTEKHPEGKARINTKNVTDFIRQEYICPMFEDKIELYWKNTRNNKHVEMLLGIVSGGSSYSVLKYFCKGMDLTIKYKYRGILETDDNIFLEDGQTILDYFNDEYKSKHITDLSFPNLIRLDIDNMEHETYNIEESFIFKNYLFLLLGVIVCPTDDHVTAYVREENGLWRYIDNARYQEEMPTLSEFNPSYIKYFDCVCFYRVVLTSDVYKLLSDV